VVLGKRSERVGEVILGEISRLLLREVKDPRIGFVTLTGIDLTDDLRHAKVYISALGDEDARQKTLEGLSSCAGFLRSRLGRELRLRYVPELAFHWDTSIAQGVRISQVIDELKVSREAAVGVALEQIVDLIRRTAPSCRLFSLRPPFPRESACSSPWYPCRETSSCWKRCTSGSGPTWFPSSWSFCSSTFTSP